MPGTVDFSQLDKLDAQLKEVLHKAPEKRKQLHEELAAITKRTVDLSIDASVRDQSGRLKSWQEKHVGSGGGYAAVRPTDSSSGDKSPGAITNYVNSGHRIRPPGGKDPNYRPRINVPYVNGAHFYQSAAATIESQAIAAAERFVDDLAGILEGK